MEQTKSAFLCLETTGDVIINCQVGDCQHDEPQEYFAYRAVRYLGEGGIPQNKLMALYFNDRSMIRETDSRSVGELIDLNAENINAGHGASGVEASLRIAAFCITEDLKPTVENMHALVVSPRWAEFYRNCECKLGILATPQEGPCEPFRKPDDWSFTFGMTDRNFTMDEKKDILALGCIMSTGFNEQTMNLSTFPSVGSIKSVLDEIHAITHQNHELQDFVLDSPRQMITERAAKILDEKYPQVAGPIKDLTGYPYYKTGCEVYACISGDGEYIHAGCNNEGMGFYEFMESVIHKEKEPPQDCVFERYRFDDPIYRKVYVDDVKGLVENTIRYEREKGTMPMNELGFCEVKFCMENGRNPLHPDNRHEKLITEQPFLEFSDTFHNRYDRTPEIKDFPWNLPGYEEPGNKNKMGLS